MNYLPFSIIFPQCVGKDKLPVLDDPEMIQNLQDPNELKKEANRNRDKLYGQQVHTCPFCEHTEIGHKSNVERHFKKCRVYRDVAKLFAHKGKSDEMPKKEDFEVEALGHENNPKAKSTESYYNVMAFVVKYHWQDEAAIKQLQGRFDRLTPDAKLAPALAKTATATRPVSSNANNAVVDNDDNDDAE